MRPKISKRLLITISVVIFNLSFCIAQTTIKGTIVNSATGEAFAGSRVTAVGTTNMVMTEENGTFILTVADKNGLLRVEAPGFEDQFVPLQGRTELFIKLLPQTKAEPVTLTTDDAVQRQILGDARVTTHSGQDLAGAALFVRGLHSINMQSQPLFIVDGQIWQTSSVVGDFESPTSLHAGYFSNPLALIAPEDIERIEVLKNGTAIWGSKAAGGVVVITTKRSRNMATEIEVNLSAGIKQQGRTLPLLSAKDYRILASDLLPSLGERLRVGEPSSGMGLGVGFLDDNTNTSYYKANHNDTDWQDAIGHTATTQNYGIAVRGGDDIALYAFSLGYAHNEGTIRNTDFDRLNVRFNSDIDLTTHLKTRADIAFAQVSRNLFDDGIVSANSPRYMAYIKSPLYNAHQFDTQGNLYDRLSDVDELGIGNPMAIIENAEGKTKNYRFTATLAPTYNFNDRISLSATANYAWDKIKESAFLPDFGLPAVQLLNAQGDWYGQGDNSVASIMTRHSTLTLGIEANWKILTSHLSLLTSKLGFRYMNDSFESDYGQGYNTGSDNLRSLSVTNSALRTTTGINDDWRDMAWYVQADYALRNRYLLSASATMETNSRFGRDADGGLKLGGVQWGLFPAVEAGWVVTGEPFMRHARGINYLKLHAAYELTGNDDLSVGGDLQSPTKTYFESIGYAGLAKGLVLSNIGNDCLKWERTGTLTLGLDARLLGNRLSVRADYFRSTTNDLLVRKQLREEYGLQNYWTNDGSLQNEGFEVALSGRIIDKRDWQLNANLTLGHYKNKVTHLTDGSFTTVSTVVGGSAADEKSLGATILTSEGQPLGVFYGYRTDGIYTTAAEAQADAHYILLPNGTRQYFQAGDMRFLDLSAAVPGASPSGLAAVSGASPSGQNGLIDEHDMTIIGDPNPDVYGSFGFNLTWKHLTLDALFTYSLGNDAYNALRQQLESGSTLSNQSEAMRRRWTADGQQTDIPRATYGDPMGNSRFSDRWIEDASYLKLKQVSLTYRLPIKPKFIQGMSLWASVSNVFTLTRYLGADPEFSYGNAALGQGIDASLLPSSRSYDIGIKLNL